LSDFDDCRRAGRDFEGDALVESVRSTADDCCSLDAEVAFERRREVAGRRRGARRRSALDMVLRVDKLQLWAAGRRGRDWCWKSEKGFLW